MLEFASRVVDQMYRVMLEVARGQRPLSVRSHLLIIAAFLLIPVLILVGVLAAVYLSSERARLEQEAVATAVQTATVIDRELAGLIRILDTLATAPSLASGDLRAFYEHATKALISHDLFVALIDANDGQRLLHTRAPFGAPLPKAAVSLPEVTRIVRESGRPYVSDLLLGTVTQQPVLGVFVPVRLGETIPYLLAIGFNPKHIAEILKQADLPAGWAAGAVDRIGVAIARSALHEERAGKPSTNFGAFRDRGSGVVTNFQGQRMFYGTAISKVSGWTIWTNAPLAVIEAKLWQTLLILAAMGISLVLLAVGLASFYGRRLARPIQLAAEEAKKLGLGASVRPCCSPLREANELIDALHEASREIQERTKQLTDEMKRREQVQQALVVAQRREAFGQLAAGIAHDFNNLLAIVLSSNELLERRLQGKAERGLLDHSTAAVEKGARLTQRLLAFARQRPAARVSMNLNDEVRETVRLLSGRLGPNIRINTTLAQDLQLTLADPSEIENAIMNLAINARDAMPRGGTLTFETRNVTVHEGSEARELELPQGEYVLLSVSDTGHGMAPEVLAHKFEPFFTTKGEKGTGLGLATIYGSAKQSGGNVTIQSELGRGTTVCLYLPTLSHKCADGIAGHAKATCLPEGSPASSGEGSREKEGELQA